MATNYPGALDTLTNPASTDRLTSPSHAAQHANANDAIEAIEATLGIDPQGSEATVADRIAAVEASAGLAFAALSATGGSTIPTSLTARATTAAITCDGTVAVSAQVTATAGDLLGQVQVAVRLLTSPGGATVATSPTYSQDFTGGAANDERVNVAVSHVFTGVAAGSYTVVLLVGRTVAGSFTVDTIGGYVIH